MAAGEGGADSLPPPSPSLPGPLPGPERALEEAVASGSLSLAGRRLRHFPGGAARRWDLSDTTQADLSRNRFAEVPEDACHLMSLEGLSLYHNCLRSLPPAIANLQALTHLNVSRNQISALPACLCRLPLKVLIASNNKLASLPEDIGSLGSLRQLDVSSNELRSLPGSMGGLECLRDLNVRRNQITILPEELAELPLVRLDFSCNLVTRLPVCFRHLRSLQCLLLENNPLQFPPAQVCLKGKIHIFKYLNVEACGKGRPDLAELAQGRPAGFGTCLPDDFYLARQHGGLDSGFHSVDSGSKRWSGNESTDEFSDLSFRIAELARDPKQLREKRGGAGDAGELEQIDYIDSSVNGEEEEEDSLVEEEAMGPPPAGRASKAWSGFPGTAPHEEPQKHARIPSQRVGAAEPGLTTGRSSSGAGLAKPEFSAEERRRPELLQLWQERERQHQRWTQGAERPDSSSLAEKGSGLPQPKHPGQGAEQPAGSPRHSPRSADPLLCQSSTAASLAPRDASLAQRPSSFLFRSSSQKSTQRSSDSPSPELSSPSRSRAGSQAPDERELLGQLRKAIESHLNLILAEDLGEALADGVILCQLANRLCPRSVPFIHVPSPAVPKLNAAKSRKNLQSFLAACRQLGIPEVSLCGGPDIALLLQGNVRGFLCLLEALLLLHPAAGGTLAPAALHGHLAGFGVFYACVMLLLYFAYCQLCGFCCCC
ncbi:leucine-rich repeat and calponin homology domain-containing protein 4 isoform X1 [Pantherophis guttatus]|uniref:Leucine-rich repeat and calponin homology domain-containing protein 4 isoform X1 n=1 Tax=Pantherophis guttatus TaxID=94885 RepID=A0A6P9CU57_PANGU|nr:leucine-rich repeat and calponin homology domain-containing protein 4 isoform X1 [Pantherophis guttatus]